jgi:hypothetical protein
MPVTRYVGEGAEPNLRNVNFVILKCIYSKLQNISPEIWYTSTSFLYPSPLPYSNISRFFNVFSSKRLFNIFDRNAFDAVMTLSDMQ